MFGKDRVIMNFLFILILWIISGYFFYLGWQYSVINCSRIFNSEALFALTITLGLFNGLTSYGIFQLIEINNKKTTRNLILIFFIYYILSLLSIFVFELIWLFSMFSLFSIFGFTYCILDYDEGIETSNLKK